MPKHERPAISVIVITRRGAEHIRTTLRALAAQSIRDRVELIVVATPSPRVDVGELDALGFMRVRLLEVPAIDTTGEALAEATRVASADVVAYAEEHGYPLPTWAEARVAAHRAGWTAVGARVINANPGSVVSHAALLSSFADVLNPREGEAERLPWHQTSYSRSALLEQGDALGHLLDIEGLLHIALRRRGYRLYQSAEPAVRHVNPSRFGAFLVIEFEGGRAFGAARSVAERWPVSKRLVHSLGAPIVPILRLLQRRRAIGQLPLSNLRRGAAALLSLIGGVAYATGEVVGYVAGPAADASRLVEYEQNRRSMLVPADWPIMDGTA